MSRQSNAALEAADEFNEGDRAEIAKLLEAGRADVRAGRTVPFEDVLGELEEIEAASAK